MHGTKYDYFVVYKNCTSLYNKDDIDILIANQNDNEKEKRTRDLYVYNTISHPMKAASN